MNNTYRDLIVFRFIRILLCAVIFLFLNWQNHTLAQGYGWTLNPLKSYEFNNQSRPFAWDFVLGGDGWHNTACGWLYPDLIHNDDPFELNSYNPNDITALPGLPRNVYYSTVNGQSCATLKVENVGNFPYAYQGCYDPDTYKTWRSGWIQTKTPDGHGYNYGKFEMSSMIPAGRGFWPAFWLWGGGDHGNGGGEIDIFEPTMDTGTELDETSFHFHSVDYCNGGLPGGDGGFVKSIPGLDLSTDFHIYSVEWTEDHLIYRIDDKIQFMVLREYSPDKYQWPYGPLDIIVNIAVDGVNFPPNDASTPDEAEMHIDYIRYWHELCPNLIICDNTNYSLYEGDELYFAIPPDINEDNLPDEPDTWGCPKPWEPICGKFIAEGETVTANADHLIVLYPGFEADFGSTFIAEANFNCNWEEGNERFIAYEYEVGRNYDEEIKFLELFPNPTGGLVTISISENSTSHIKSYIIEVISILGAVQKVVVMNSSRTKLDLSNLANGLYNLRLIEDNGRVCDSRLISVISQ